MTSAPLFGGRELTRVLLLGAHADDIEIGCGGTVLRLAAAWPHLEVRWHVFAAPGARHGEACASAADFLRDLKKPRVCVSDFRESYFPQDWAAIKDLFEQIKEEFDADLILTHWGDDRHQDHRVISELTWNTFRNHTILEYEIPKYDGDLGRPNFYVALDEATCERKIRALLKNFPSQTVRHWFTEDTFRALLRLRGLECGPRVHDAEAFYARKLIAHLQ